MDRKIDRRHLLGAAGVTVVGLVVARLPAAAKPAHFQVSLSDAEWRKRLGSQRYALLREAATERPFSSPLD